MAIESVGVGSFIPNSAGLPRELALSPAERAEVAAEKARKDALSKSETSQAIVFDGTTAESGGVNNRGETVTLDV